VASYFRDPVMVSPKREVSHQCDRCGSPNIVALSLLHDQETRTNSQGFTSQSYSAQRATPPQPRSYGLPIFFFSVIILFILFCSLAYYSAAKHAPFLEYPIGCLLIVAAACIAALTFICRNIAQYNRDVFPTIYWNWTHTYLCRRCGKLLHLPT
jgi:ribosomal protein L37E